MNILQWPDPILTKPCAQAKHTGMGRIIGTIIKEKLRAHGDTAAGLAAPQLGYLISICAVKLESGEILLMYNPLMVDSSGWKIAGYEGCLSIPEVWRVVPRFSWVEISWENISGQKETRRFHEWEARVVQHEMDHLMGKLILDYDQTNTNHQDLVLE